MNIERVESEFAGRLAASLVEWGFTQCNQGQRYLIVAPWGEAEAQISCAARLNHEKRALVTLFLGIRFERVETILAKTYVDPRCSTVAVPIYWLHSDRRSAEWDASDSNVYRALLPEVESYGIPFFEKFHNLVEVQKSLESQDPKDWFSETPGGRIETLAAVLAARGDKQSALTLLDSEIANIHNLHTPPNAARRFRLQKLRGRVIAA